MASTTPMLCPFCGKGPIQLDAGFCDLCGKDLSNFWVTFKFLENQSLLRKPVQQMAVDEQKKTDKALTERTSLETRLSVPVPLSKPDAIATRPQADSTRLTGEVREKSKLPETVPRAELEARESDTEILRKDRDNLRERVRDLEAQLVKSVPRTRLEAEQSETENLRTELSRLRDEKAQSEARIEKLSGDQAKALQSTPASKLVESEVHPQTVEENVPDLTRAYPGGRPEPASKSPKSGLIKSLFNRTARPVKCEACGYSNRVDAAFCSNCGQVVVVD